MDFHVYSLSQQEPMALIQRCLILDNLRKADPKLLQAVHENFVIVYDEYDDDGEKHEKVEIDWAWCLFGATMYQLMLAIKAYEKNKEPEKKKSPIIVDLQGNTADEKPNIIV